MNISKKREKNEKGKMFQSWRREHFTKHKTDKAAFICFYYNRLFGSCQDILYFEKGAIFMEKTREQLILELLEIFCKLTNEEFQYVIYVYKESQKGNKKYKNITREKFLKYFKKWKSQHINNE